MSPGRATIAALLLGALQASAGEWHAGPNNLCADCHTMHFSMAHAWDGMNPVGTTVAPNGNWLGATGPNEYLLKLPANDLCLACHDGQTFAPDVIGLNTNPAPVQGRSAGAVNRVGMGAPYEEWKGHTLDSKLPPPGFDPTRVGAPGLWYDPAVGLRCIDCHAVHGAPDSYRNLGPYALGPNVASFQPTYTISLSNDPTKDVWINLPGYRANSQSAASFNPYYDTANVSFNRNDAVAGLTQSSNRLDAFCGACHGTFHGGPGEPSIGASPAALYGFLRHPTSKVAIGAALAQGYLGHSELGRYAGASTKVRVYSTHRTTFLDATPGCVTCHKAHGNQNPFGLIFQSPRATLINEEGGWDNVQLQELAQGYRNLCSQCHGQ